MMHTLYPVNHLMKTTQESTLGLHFNSFKSQHQFLRNLKFYQLRFIWAPLYVLEWWNNACDGKCGARWSKDAEALMGMIWNVNTSTSDVCRANL